MKINENIGVTYFMMAIISLIIYLLNANGDSSVNLIELLSFCGIFLFIPALVYLTYGE